MKETNLPINDFLHDRLARHPVCFHMPGHCQGKLLDGKFKKNIALYDITEIPGADNLHRPTGIIKKSQEETAKIYKAYRTHYLVNGSTVGLHAVMGHAARKNPKMIISRDAHVSVLNAAILFGVEPVFVEIGYDYKDFLPLTIDIEALEKTLGEHPDSAGLLVTSPNYFGMTADIDAISRMVHAYGMFLAVDQAHGAHFPFHPRFPKNACEAGADMVCMSAHKTLPVLNQGGFLHTGKNMEMEGMVSMLQTTSPSYPILASLESAVQEMKENGEREYEKLFHRIRDFSNALHDDGRYHIQKTNDFSRLVIWTGGIRRSGYEVARILHETYNVIVEMADLFNIVLITTRAHTRNDFDVLEKALKDIEPGLFDCPEFRIPPTPERYMAIGKAFDLPKKRVELDASAGCVCGTIIMTYPPGIPILSPGDIIGSGTLEYLLMIRDLKGGMTGITDNKIEVLA
ncbi:MAG: aminotransferase class I/II-fold pyridoxal phosphate-dependent enzyme [Clostridia bacterium]